ncbi:MAG: uracil-DNA glycosylase [Gammaproteobacteria bacterium]|nr:uracil-DNA glycosylase [Gammaproteobacteria bacterium]
MSSEFFNLDNVHFSWKECIENSLQKIDANYLQTLVQSKTWLPGRDKIFNAFSLPLNQVKYVLFGESPYPRQASANGYAFWDAAVENLWSSTGLSKKVNRATSLRNIIKMLLTAEGLLTTAHSNQEAIAQIKKNKLIQTNKELFHNLLKRGFLLLNATPVLTSGSPQKEARAWHPFIRELLLCLHAKNPDIKFILLGRIANTIDTLIPSSYKDRLYAEHPYNHSFITNPDVLAFFKPLHLLTKE